MKKHSVKISGHPSSVSLEDEFWDALKAIAKARGQSLNSLISDIDENMQTEGQHDNLSSAIRIFVLRHVSKSNPDD